MHIITNQKRGQVDIMEIIRIMSNGKKGTRGGKRPFSGRKKKDYETKTIAFRVRVEFVEPIKKMVKEYVSGCLKGDA